MSGRLSVQPGRLALAILLAGAVLWAGAQTEPSGFSPDEIRRVLLPEKQRSDIEEQLRKGTRILLPRDEFEQLVRQARQTLQAGEPSLIESHYRATLVESLGASGVVPETHLTGTGTWKLVQPAPAPGLFSLGWISLALRECILWNRASNWWHGLPQSALLGDFNGKGLSLRLATPGEHVAHLSWSARGEQGPDGYHFDWRVPAAPLAVLELHVPAGRTVTVTPDDCLVTGPTPSGQGQEVWTIRHAGRAVLHLTVSRDRQGREPARASGELPGPEEVTVRQVTTRQHLRPAGLTSVHAFDLQVHARDLRELTFTCDPALEPFQVMAGNEEVDRWSFTPVEGKPGLLVVRFREPVRGPITLEISCTGNYPTPSRSRASPTPWVSPAVTLRGISPRIETLQLRLHPELRASDWQPGDFHPTEAATETDGTYRLTLTASDLAAGLSGKTEGVARPAARIEPQGVNCLAHVTTWWRLQQPTPTLTVRVDYELFQGRLFELPILVPDGWEVNRVSFETPGQSGPQVRAWTVRPLPSATRPPGAATRQLTAELSRPLERLPESTAERVTGALQVHLWQPGPRPAPGPRLLPLPGVMAGGVSQVEGRLIVDWDDRLWTGDFRSRDQRPWSSTARPWQVPGKLPEASRREGLPIGDGLPRASLPWQRTPPAGYLRLENRPLSLDVEDSTDVLIGPTRVEVRRLVRLKVESGQLDTVQVRLEHTPGWDWQLQPVDGKRLRSFHRQRAQEAARPLALLGTQNPLGQAVSAAAPWGARWRLVPAPEIGPGRPLEFVLVGERAFPPGTVLTLPLGLLKIDGSAGDFWLRGPVRLNLADGEGTPQLATQGLVEVPAKALAQPKWRAWKAFSPVATSARLLLANRRGEGSRSQATGETPAVTRALLEIAPSPTGQLRQRFDITVEGWSEPRLEIRLPAGAEFLDAVVDGRAVVPVIREEETGPMLSLSVPASPGSLHRFQIRHVIPGERWQTWRQVAVIPPAVQGLPLPNLRVVWRLPGGMSLLTSEMVRQLESRNSDGGDTWETIERGVRPLPVLLVRDDFVLSLAGVLGLATLAAGLAWGRSGRGRASRWPWRLLLAWLLVTGLAWVWLPLSLRPLAGLPALAGLMVLALTYLGWLVRRQEQETSASSSASAAPVAVGLVLLVGLSLLRQPSAEAFQAPSGGLKGEDLLVWIVTDPKNQNRQSVLLTPALHRRLTRPATRVAAVLIGAEYRGSANDRRADFTARLQLWAPPEARYPLPVRVPLDGVLLQTNARLNGVKIAPRADPSGKPGYFFTLPTPGIHELQVSFLVRVVGQEDERDLQLVVPRLARCRVLLETDGAARYLHALTRLGAARLTRSKNDRQLLEVDIGAGPRSTEPESLPLHFRWRKEARGSRPAEVRCKEASLWELGPRGHLLTTVLHYNIGPGAVTSLGLDIPTTLLVRSVEARRLPDPGPRPPRAPSPVRLADWQLHPPGHDRSSRKLDLQFGTPVSGSIEVVLRLEPVGSRASTESMPRGHRLGPTVTLPLARPHDTPVAEDGWLAYRLTGPWEARGRFVRLRGIPPQEFPAFFWQTTGIRSGSVAIQAFKIQREGRRDPELTLALRGPVLPITGRQWINWEVGPFASTWEAHLDLQAPAGSTLALLEVEVPPGTLRRVSAAREGREEETQVREWAREGNRLQIWLSRSVPRVSLRLAGTSPAPLSSGRWRASLPLPGSVSPLGILAQVEWLARGLTWERTQGLPLVGLQPGPGLATEVTLRSQRGQLRLSNLVELKPGASSEGWTGLPVLGPPPAAALLALGQRLRGKQLVYHASRRYSAQVHLSWQAGSEVAPPTPAVPDSQPAPQDNPPRLETPTRTQSRPVPPLVWQPITLLEPRLWESLGWISLIAALGFLAQSAWLARLTQGTWPEQLVLAGVAVELLAGLHIGAIFLCALGVSCRVLLGLRWLLGRRRTLPAASSTRSQSNPGLGSASS